MTTFREFMCRYLEESPPAGSTATAPTSSNKQNNFRYAARELGGEFDGLDPDDYLKEPITSFEPLDKRGGPRTASPVVIDVEDADSNGGLKGKMLLSLSNKQKLRNPNGSQYRAPVQDEPIRLRPRSGNKNRTWDDIVLGPLAKSGGAPKI